MIKHVAVLDILYQNYLSTGLLLYTAEVRTIACVNLNKVALVDEERYTDFNTCFKSSWLSSVCSCIALDTWLRVSNAEVCLNRHFSQEDRTIAGISNNLYDITFLLISIISHFF